MVKLIGSLMPQGAVAYLLLHICPFMSSLLTLCNRLPRIETQNLNSLESAGRGTEKVSDAAPGKRMGEWKM